MSDERTFMPRSHRVEIATRILCAMIPTGGDKADKVKAAFQYADLLLDTPEAREDRIACALKLARSYGTIDGAHHKMWVIDQMVRALTGDEYEAWVRETKVGMHGPDMYDWDEGVVP